MGCTASSAGKAKGEAQGGAKGNAQPAAADGVKNGTGTGTGNGNGKGNAGKSEDGANRAPDKLKSNTNKFLTKYQLKGVLGNGNYSVVREAVNRDNGDHVAVKVIDKKKLSKEDEEALIIEVEVLAEIDHPHIIKMFDFFEEPKNYYIVTEFMRGGELFDRIVKKEYYSEEDAQQVVRTLGDTLKYIHDKNIVHRDLKPENVLMKDEQDDAAIKIADFGFARKVPGSGLRTACGTPGYVAPEILRSEPYGKPVDMWSLGVITYILLCGYPPFYNQNQKMLFEQIKSGQYVFDSPYWDPVSDLAKSLIQGLLTVDYKKRLDVDGALHHPWVNTSVSDHDLTPALSELKKFNAKRKIRAAAKGLVAARMFANIPKQLMEAKAAQDLKSSEEAKKIAADETGVAIEDAEAEDSTLGEAVNPEPITASDVEAAQSE